jgi:GxxExxY protein
MDTERLLKCAKNSSRNSGARRPMTGRMKQQEQIQVLVKHQELPEYINEISHRVIGAAIEVHRHLGPGFAEKVYEAAMVIELGLRGIRFERQVPVSIFYREHVVASCSLDLVVEDEVVVELKAVDQVSAVHRAQVLSYLKAGAFQLGLIINFNVPMLRDGIGRVILTAPV